MMLADHILEARGGEHDIGGCITSLGAQIERIGTDQRFVLDDQISRAAYQLIQSKPINLHEAMPRCRLPYQTIWIEWKGVASLAAGWNQYPTSEPDKSIHRPTPHTMGALIETSEGSGNQRGTISWAWRHHSGGINVCGLGVNFDWSEGGDVCAWSRAALGDSLVKGSITELAHRRWVDDAYCSDASIKQMMDSRPGWKYLSRDPRQVAAVRGLLRHEAPWFCRHARGMIQAFNDLDRAERSGFLAQALRSWEGDICGEAPFITAFVLMLNSRNAIEREPSDLDRLNKARRRRGRPEFLTHTVTKMHMSKSYLRRAEALGLSRQEAGEHKVRGHLKLRATGVYWWNEFKRGDPTRPIVRGHYEATS